MSSITSKLSRLRLVYPPISNQEAEWLQNCPETEQLFRQSDFYMLCARAELTFSDIRVDDHQHVISFKLGTTGIDPIPGQIHLKALKSIYRDVETFRLEAGEKLIRIWDKQREELLDWFTAEKLLLDKWRSKEGITGLEDFQKFTIFDLLYVGIAKHGDSYNRLFEQGHKARTSILSNERQRRPGARVTDETFILLFSIEPLFIQSFSTDHEFSEEDLSPSIEHKRIVADAEKAFTSLLKPDYNHIYFRNYPKGTDGLYEAGLHSYGYVIAESITLRTPSGSYSGAYGDANNPISNDADGIFVEGDNVHILTPEGTSPPSL